MNNKVRGDKDAICLYFLSCLLNICRKFEFFISQGSIATWLRWGGQCRIGFVANSYAFQQCKNFENRSRFDKVTESLKVGTFFRHSVHCHSVSEQQSGFTFEGGPPTNLRICLRLYELLLLSPWRWRSDFDMWIWLRYSKILRYSDTRHQMARSHPECQCSRPDWSLSSHAIHS